MPKKKKRREIKQKCALIAVHSFAQHVAEYVHRDVAYKKFTESESMLLYPTIKRVYHLFLLSSPYGVRQRLERRQKKMRIKRKKNRTCSMVGLSGQKRRATVFLLLWMKKKNDEMKKIHRIICQD